VIETSQQKLIEEYKLNKRVKMQLPQDEETYKSLAADLTSAERNLREGNIDKFLKDYDETIKSYINMQDFETASYFYNRQLEVS
jgi:hypothetical protein